MTQFVNVTFDQAVEKRFNNTIVGGPSVTNVLDSVVIDPSEVFDGDGSSRWNGEDSTALQIASDTDFDFGAGQSLYFEFRFLPLLNNRFGLIGRRGNEFNRWHLILDLTDPDMPVIEFFANSFAAQIYNVIQEFGSTTKVPLGKWNTIQIAIDNNTFRIWINGIFIINATAQGGNPLINAQNSPVEIGRVNQSATASPVDWVVFSEYLDSLIFDSVVPAGYDADTPLQDIRTWTGNTERLETFDPEKVPQPGILNQQSFPNNIPDFELGTNRCYIAGIDPMKKVDGSTVSNIGMELPGVITFGAGDTPGPPDNYDYVVTWMDSRGSESGPSPVSGTQQDTSVNINQPAAPDPQATRWRVYRRHVSAGQASHYLIADEDIATTVVIDGSLTESLSIVAPVQGTTKPPTANYIAENGNRMFYADVDRGAEGKFRTRVYFSAINDYEQVGPNDWFYVGDDDSNFITGLASFNGNLVIFKERGFHVAIGDPEDSSFQIIEVSPSIGCVAHQTIKGIDRYLMWANDEGVYAWRGDSDPMIVSEHIEPFFEDMPDTRKPFMTAGVDFELGLYLLSISLDQDDENDHILCYNYRDSLADRQHRWSRWLVPVSSLGEGWIGTGRNPRAFFADKQGRLGLFERGLDLFGGINFKWQTGRFNPWNVGSKMVAHYATLMTELVKPGRRRIHAGFEMDESGERLTLFEDPTSGNFKFNVGARGEYVSLILSGTDIRERLRLFGYRLDGNGVGKR